MNISEYITPNLPNDKAVLNAAMYNKLMIDNEREDVLKIAVQDQYINFNNLGNNLLQYNIYSDGNFAEFITFVNDNYIPITNIDYILTTPKQIQALGRFIYELLTVDLINTILPKILKSQNCLPEALITSDFKMLLFEILMDRIEVLRQMVSEVNNSNLKRELVKWSYYLELFDTNLENFQLNVIEPLINTYELELYSKS